MKVLFGVFDWGLGHATRDAPLIRALLAAGHRVDVLTTGRALSVLKTRFGDDCRMFDVPSICMPYTKSRFFVVSFISHMPGMLLTLWRARQQTMNIIRANRYDLVVSDCRYDVYDEPANSILINHQLRFRAFWGGEQAVERWLTARMKCYRCVAVPDFETDDLSGVLSHGLRYYPRSRIRYIGILSHVKRRPCEKDVDYFISLTGPEPPRTILERKIREQIGQLAGRIVVAGGNPDRHAEEHVGDVSYYDYLEPSRQEEMMNRAKFLISRSGYTTMMELCEVGLPHALLMPTPGQTEQEYLARYHEDRGHFACVSQYELQLARDVERARGFGGFEPQWRTDESVRRFMELCRETG